MKCSWTWRRELVPSDHYYEEPPLDAPQCLLKRLNNDQDYDAR